MRRLMAVLVLAVVAAGCGGGDEEAATSAPGGSDRPFPYAYGDDEAFDNAYDLCAAGEWAACDELGLAAPEGSEYQSFGRTCGNLTDGLQPCETVMAGGTSVPSDPQAPEPTQATPTTQPNQPPAPSAEVVTFTTDRSTVGPGECALLQWTTRNADLVTLGGVAVSHPSGQQQVCYDELNPGAVNTYQLVASNGQGSQTASIGLNKDVPAPPEAVAFISDTDVVLQGQCVTLQWTTRNADAVFLDAAPVSNPAGQQIICWDEMGVGDNVFRLSAVNAIGSDELDLLIRAEAPTPTIIDSPFVPGRSGSVSSDGRDLPFVSPGDDGSNFLYDGFMTFDIRNLPANASIVSAYLNLGTCATLGDGLGDLQVFNLQYGDLDADDFQAGGAFIALVDPCTIFSIDVTDRVKAMKTEVEFQVRLAFSDSDYDGNVDDVTYTGPTLEITYVIP